MAPLPKKKISSARRGKRRAAIKYVTPTLISCPNCKAHILPHTTCYNCGTYKGKLVKPPKVKTKVTKTQK